LKAVCLVSRKGVFPAQLDFSKNPVGKNFFPNWENKTSNSGLPELRQEIDNVDALDAGDLAVDAIFI